MNEHIRERRELLQRESKGRNIRPDWIQKMNSACGVLLTEDKFLPLDVTAQLRERFFDKVRSNDLFHKWFSATQLDDLVGHLCQLQTLLKNPREVILFHSKDTFLGVVKIDIRVVLSNIKAVWEVVEDDFSLSTPDVTSGICVEHGFYNEHGNYVSDGAYELTTWGVFSQPSCPSPKHLDSRDDGDQNTTQS